MVALMISVLYVVYGGLSGRKFWAAQIVGRKIWELYNEKFRISRINLLIQKMKHSLQ